MQIQRIEVPGLAHFSYVVSGSGMAVVIDPKRDFDTYVDYAAAHGLKITHILETHIHADYASGALGLAEATRAELWLSAHDTGEDFEYKFKHREFKDGDELTVGCMRFQCVHTPGHTPEHISFLLYDNNRNPETPLAFFTGDFLFVGSLGRPDLLGEEAKLNLAKELHKSVHERIKHLPDGLEVYPAHGAGSMCGSGMSDRQTSTLGYERATNPFFKLKDQKEFVDTILGSVPPFPDYYKRMKRVNSDGAPRMDQMPGKKALSPQQLKDAVAKDAVVLDVRRPEAFGGAHVPNAINIGAGTSLSTWAAWVLPYDKPIYIVDEDGSSQDTVARSLIRVGLDQVAGYLKGGMKTWLEAGFEQGHIQQISVDELQAKKDALLLDVRGDGEWKGGHIATAKHIMAGDLPKKIDSLPRDKEINIICGSGYRSSISTSILRKAGFEKVVNVVGGMTAWNKRGLPTVR